MSKRDERVVRPKQRVDLLLKEVGSVSGCLESVEAQSQNCQIWSQRNCVGRVKIGPQQDVLQGENLLSHVEMHVRVPHADVVGRLARKLKS